LINIVYDNIFLRKKPGFLNKTERNKERLFSFFDKQKSIFFHFKKALNEKIRVISFLENSCAWR
jgi:hypothetical protein